MKTMQKNRIVLAITAVVVLALLFAGIGYAFSGDARTYNKDDDQTLAYMSVTPADFSKIFTGDTIFDTYVYEGDTTATADIKTAYAFDKSETVVDMTVSTTNYKAVELGSKYLTVLNNTGAAITAFDFTVNATRDVGSTDFVFIFKLSTMKVATAWAADTIYYEKAEKCYSPVNPQPEEGSTVTSYFVEDVTDYLVYDGSKSETAKLTFTVADTENADVNVTVYVAYTPNVYVPNTYIGPAGAAMNGHQATTWVDGVTYYTDVGCETKADTQPANQAAIDAAIEAGNPFYESWLPYIQTKNAPVDLLTTSFGIEVTDANA